VFGIAAKHRLALTLCVVLILSFVAVSGINYEFTRRAARAELLSSTLPLTSDTIYSEIQADLIRPIYVSSLMANDTFLKDWATDGERDLDQIKRYLREIRDQYGFFTSFFVSARSMKYYYYDGVLKTVSRQDEHDVWYYDFIAGQKKWELDVDTNEAAHDTLTIFINHRLQTPWGELLGVTGVGLKMSIVSDMVARYMETYGRNVYFVDESGLVQVHADGALVLTENLRRMPGVGAVAERLLAVREGNADAEYERDGRTFLVTARYIPEFHWIMVVEQDDAASLATARRNLLNTLLVGLLTAALVSVICIGAVNVFHRRLEILAATDELTGLANRREFERVFLRSAARQRRHGGELSMVLLDVDGFKAINDAFGHLAGDEVLRVVGRAVTACVRDEDLVARWGGDEFLVLAECGLDRAGEMAERIRRAVAALDVAALRGASGEEAAPRVSVTHGAAVHLPGESLDAFLARADQAMYAAKQERACGATA